MCTSPVALYAKYRHHLGSQTSLVVCIDAAPWIIDARLPLPSAAASRPGCQPSQVWVGVAAVHSAKIVAFLLLRYACLASAAGSGFCGRLTMVAPFGGSLQALYGHKALSASFTAGTGVGVANQRSAPVLRNSWEGPSSTNDADETAQVSDAMQGDRTDEGCACCHITRTTDLLSSCRVACGGIWWWLGCQQEQLGGSAAARFCSAGMQPNECFITSIGNSAYSGFCVRLQARKAGGTRMLPAWQRDGLSGVTGFSSRLELSNTGRPGSSGPGMGKAMSRRLDRRWL